MPYKYLSDEFTKSTQEIFGDNLTGIYLHGSAAMGCYNPNKSDIDLIVVVESDISDAQKTGFMNVVVRLNAVAPKKGIEVSIVKRCHCDPFVFPTPFELHFSPTHLQRYLDDPQRYIATMHGVDADLAAHFTVINKYGVALCGKNIRDVFCEVPYDCYIAAVMSDIENAESDIFDQPVYVALNLCRTLAFVAEGLYLSKRDGGEWALRNKSTQEYSDIISAALNSYCSDAEPVIDKIRAKEFAKAMLSEIKHNIEIFEQSK